VGATAENRYWVVAWRRRTCSAWAWFTLWASSVNRWELMRVVCCLSLVSCRVIAVMSIGRSWAISVMGCMITVVRVMVTVTSNVRIALGFFRICHRFRWYRGAFLY